ncbi:MAG: DUF1330 domain-containing protein [Burkholderiales bacterium]|jgi:uncharacterized protein (DUF1330 family)|nr:DUF1330 domain-containing protein [Burkholderiales bacterium]MCA3155605.1 DUF1330 domain-containing protein [Burkholderiales bacterium]MCA3156946.1 DUF1330 domain-containing protein [Burkholderiales bacterium]MCA3158512.1 DUF1330 domain-containing protein [Burkholderiales bacterium]MCA3161340.1 DUF1330 domain-containing protein [Burkholderiales bacterium]
MSAYLIFNVDVKKPQQYEVYRKWSSLAIKAYDAKVLVRGGATTSLEGQPPHRIVILQFPSVEKAQAFYDSPQYKRARNAREGAALANIFIVQGVE